MSKQTVAVLVICLILLLALTVRSVLGKTQIQKTQPPAQRTPATSVAKTETPMTTLGKRGLWRFDKSILPDDIPPASCDEWATQSPPSSPVGSKCKVLGGTGLCDRASGIHAGTYDIGPIDGQAKVGQSLTVHFRVRDFGSGDAIVYPFGKVDWGDNSQQGLGPFGYDVPLTHTYTSSRGYVIRAMFGAQFKYQGSPTQTGPVISGSYEACVDGSIPVTITP